MRVESEVSGIGNSGGTDYRLGLRFDRPTTFNEDTDFYLESELEKLDEVAFQSHSFEIETGMKCYASSNREYGLGLGYHFRI